MGEGGGARISTLGVPAVEKQTKRGDPQQVQVGPVVPIPLRKQNTSDFGGHTPYVQANLWVLRV